jgi:hypothetical protein
MEISVTDYAARQGKSAVRARQLITAGRIIVRRVGRMLLIEETQLWPGGLVKKVSKLLIIFKN